MRRPRLRRPSASFTTPKRCGRVRESILKLRSGWDTASRRGVTPKKLSDTLRGELDAIVLTAIDRDPERRYQSTSALAQDLGRYLDGHVVLARPPSARYRLGKFLRRYRVQVGAAFARRVGVGRGIGPRHWSSPSVSESRRGWRVAAAAEAEENLQKFHQLAIGARVERAEAMLADLKPAWPSKLPALSTLASKSRRATGCRVCRACWRR